MLREEVISQWSGLKTKVSSLKFTEQDKQTAKYLEKCPLESFFVGTVRHDELDDWEKKIKEAEQKLKLLPSENEVIENYWFLATQYAATILNWIELKKNYSDSREAFIELDEWKITSHHLLFKARQAIRTGMNNTSLLWEIKEGKLSINDLMEAQEIRENSAPMVKILTQIGQIDFIDEVYSDGPTIVEVD